MSHAQNMPSKEHLFDEFDSLVTETVQLLKTVRGNDGELFDAGKTAIEDGLATAGARLAKIRDQYVRQAQTAANATDRYVHENPWRTAGIVATVSALSGLAAGMLISRR